MKRKLLLLLVLSLISLGVAGCGNGTGTNSKNSSNKASGVKTGVAPVADNEIAVIELENPAYGSIKLELYSNIAPQMVARFKELARSGFYDGIIFHRVNPSVIQAGNPNTKPGMSQAPGQPEGNSGKPNVPAEFSDVPFDRGTLGAARLGNDINSANSQFFITLKREQPWDKNYTVFGKVIDGMNNAFTIAGAPKNGESPVDPIRIKTIRIEAKQ